MSSRPRRRRWHCAGVEGRELHDDGVVPAPPLISESPAIDAVHGDVVPFCPLHQELAAEAYALSQANVVGTAAAGDVRLLLHAATVHDEGVVAAPASR